MNRANASFSRTYLTRDNYRGPTLLRSIRGRDCEEYKASQCLVEKEKNQNMEIDKNRDDRYIFGPPESSGDEDDILLKNSATSSPRPPKNKAANTTSPSTKRQASTAASARPKRRKLQDKPTLDTVQVADDPTSTDLFGGMTSSSSQKRRLNKGYAQRKFMKQDRVDDEPKPLRKEQGFVTIDEVEVDEKEVPKTKFVHVDQVAVSTNIRRSPRGKQTLTTHDLSDEMTLPMPKTSALLIPEKTDFSSSGGTENPELFDSFDSPEKNSRKRSGSTSSLSSVDDMYILAHDDEYKADPEPDPERDSSAVLCPVCQKRVRDSVSLFVPDNLRTMPFRQQKKFCSQHRVADAKGLWQRRGYPEICWEDLEGFQIHQKLPDLRRVIVGATSSFYRDQLDGKITAAKGDRRKIQLYLKQGLIDVAKPGYYGPKGARIMVDAITGSLKETLTKALTSDSTLRAAGVGGYVSAVLVPELTLQLVMDDMKLKTATEGRKVLDESTEIGVLLNPDDDHVERKDEDED